ncbi:MAG TPA: formylglycine-generating enzyme family protein [Sulfurovum sp.]|uniref:formylglycine-generating enzyme family protein n=1 Tax=Sulfurovum sp. TaxID=1969726 RepID=UPI002F93718D
MINDNFVQLPRGSFLMGSDDPLAREREKPLHEVHIAYDIAMCKFPVTVEEYMLFAQATGAEVPEEKHEHLGFDVPVRRVRFHDAKAYCEWKSQREGKTFRLPTEAEWEYACRAGSTGNYCFGNDETLLGDHAWYKENSEGVTHNVGMKKPNAWGLYDMHGNVWEWCLDWYSETYAHTPTDGTAYNVPNEKGRVLRGGSWNGSAENSRCSSRINLGSGGRNYFVGFRVVMEL